MVADDRSNPKNWLGPYADADTGWVALRAAERQAYLASALAEYLEVREWTPERLAEWLRCSPRELAQLGLCRRPDPAATEFAEQVTQIVTRFQLDYWNLRRLLEELALDPQERQRVCLSEAFLDEAGHRPSNRPVSGEFTRMFGARADQAMAQPKSHSAEPAEPQQAVVWKASGEAPQVTMPATPVPAAGTRQPSWFGRLLAALRNFFSRK